MDLRKDYVVTNISASPDGSPYVLVTLKDPKDLGGPQIAPEIAQLNSMDDMLRNIGRVITTQMVGGFATIIKFQLSEYEDLDIKVGDKVSLVIDKVQVAPL